MLMMTNVDTLLLTKLSGLESVAIYNVALPVVQIFQVSMVILLVFAPIATDLWQRGRREDLAAACRFVVDALTLIGGTVVIILITASGTVIGILFGGGFEEAAAPLALLGAGMPMLAIAQFYLYILPAIGRPTEIGAVSVASTLLNIALNAILIPLWSVKGAALATAIAYAAMMLMSHQTVSTHVGLRISHRGWRRTVLQSAGFGILGYVLSPYAPGVPRTLLVSGGLVALFVLVNRQRIVSLWLEGRTMLAGRSQVRSAGVAPGGNT